MKEDWAKVLNLLKKSKKTETELKTEADKALKYLRKKENLSPATLNKLALLAGFQNWHDLQMALHGNADASVNYDDEQA